MSSCLLLLSLFMSCVFVFMNHPLAMGLVLLIQTCLIALMTGSLSNLFWFSYILFLVFLGGMLVLFIYMTSLASNEMFTISTPILLISPLLILLLTGLTSSTLLFDWLNPSSSNWPSWNTQAINGDFLNVIMKLYSTFSSHLTILLACYLFLTLIAVVSLTKMNQGPLRSYS
uniref:NADH-ubiquinone oxidoreductase chain 6 n=1 Tax=Serratella sp. Yunnan-2018 TaxID=2748058 RepID=A0A7D6J9C2_9INSE|nr:NADH dehydrogenase subunit 6 [Serratella sp. Yunnan-2018]QLP88992.1 NADH dehydrogenase subunit 6 [Serratella sp. Yunnan-2018]